MNIIQIKQNNELIGKIEITFKNPQEWLVNNIKINFIKEFDVVQETLEKAIRENTFNARRIGGTIPGDCNLYFECISLIIKKVVTQIKGTILWPEDIPKLKLKKNVLY